MSLTYGTFAFAKSTALYLARCYLPKNSIKKLNLIMGTIKFNFAKPIIRFILIKEFIRRLNLAKKGPYFLQKQTYKRPDTIAYLTSKGFLAEILVPGFVVESTTFFRN